MEIVLNSGREVVGITEDEYLLDLLEDTGGRGGQVQKIAMSNSFHKMAFIAKTVKFDSVLNGRLGVQLFVIG